MLFSLAKAQGPIGPLCAMIIAADNSLDLCLSNVGRFNFNNNYKMGARS